MLAEYAAVKARLNAHVDLAGKGSDAIRMEAGLPVRANYWVLFGGPPDELGDGRLAGVQRPDSDAEYVYPLRLVGTTFDAVMQMADRAMTQLVGWAPTLAGRACQPIELDEFPDKVDADTRVSPALLFLDLEFILKSNRA